MHAGSTASFASKHSSLEARCAACGLHLIWLSHDLIQACKPAVLLLGCIWLAVTWMDSGMQAQCAADGIHLIGCHMAWFRQSGSAAARSLTKPAMMWSGYGGRWTDLMWRSVTNSTRPLLSTKPCRSEKKRKETKTKEKKRKEKKRQEQEKKRKDYAFRRQVNEKPSIISGCPPCRYHQA